MRRLDDVNNILGVVGIVYHKDIITLLVGSDIHGNRGLYMFAIIVHNAGKGSSVVIR